MFRRKNILLLAVCLLIIFFITTNYLLVTLPTESVVRISTTIEENIYQELNILPSHYKVKHSKYNNEVLLDTYHNFKKTSETHDSENTLETLWTIANSWINGTQLLDVTSHYIGDILLILKEAKIIQADIDSRGTQLKLLLTLQGNQQVIFKPKWYDRNKIVDGPVYAGKDRYNSEIVAFYLSVILNKPLCPPSVERQISLKQDILPVATKSINDPVCDDDNSSLFGAVIFNFKANLINHRSPWQRTYKKGKIAGWQKDPENYCNIVKEKISRKRLYDLIDISILDFLIQNGDRHHYETLEDTVLWLDNGKGLGNPYKYHIDILAPLYQCCMMRKSTLKTLLSLTGGRLGELLKQMPNTNNLLTPDHFKAIEERLLLIFATIEHCKKYNKTNM